MYSSDLQITVVGNLRVDSSRRYDRDPISDNVTACISYFKPFYESLESVMVRSDDMQRCGGDTLNSSRYFYMI